MTHLFTLAVIFLMSHGGHVYGGQPFEFSVRPAVQGLGDGWTMRWQLQHAGLELANGALPMDANGGTLRVELPEVRVPVQMRLTYQIIAPPRPAPLPGVVLDEQVVNENTTGFWVHPRPDTSWVQRQTAIQSVVLMGHNHHSTLADALVDMGLKVRRVKPNNRMGMASADWLLVEAQGLDDNARRAVRRAAQRGARVLLVGPDTVPETEGLAAWTGGEDVLRPVTALQFKTGHPLLAGLEPQWIRDWPLSGRVVTAQRITDRRAVTPIVGWPNPDAQSPPPTSDQQTTEKQTTAPEAASEPALLDALVWTQPVGEGHLIVWRLPVADWSTDPRAGLVLQNALLYLASPPPPIGPDGATVGPPSTESSP